MPTAPSYPGVYIEEVSSGVHTISGVATSIAAFVGYTNRGPVDEARLILNFADFQRQFGDLSPDSEIAYAVQQFFLNGGSSAYVVRVAQGAIAASVEIKDLRGNPALVVTAASKGAWGNNLRLDVDYATANPDSTFNLRVRQYRFEGDKAIVVSREDHLNLSMNSRAANYALGVVNEESRLVRLALPSAGMTLADATDRGFSLSANLVSAFPSLTPNSRVLNGVLDGTTSFSLQLADPLPTDLTGLVTSVNSAIAQAGLATRLAASRSDLAGGTSGSLVCLKLQSSFVATNSATKAEFSSVQIISAPANDAARKLTLGRANRGREKEGASVCRPAQTGTTSADLSDLIGTQVTGVLNVTVNNNSSGASVALSPQATTAAITTTLAGQVSADAIKAAIKNLNQPATDNLTVQLNGSFLRIAPGTANADVSIVFDGAFATATRLNVAGKTFVNVQQYALGGGVTFFAQTGAIPGADGTPPGATQIIGDALRKDGMQALRNVDLFNLLLIPRTAQMASSEANSVYAAALKLCEERRAFYLLDPDRTTKTVYTIGDWLTRSGAKSRNGALFFPQLKIADPLDSYRLALFPSSAAVAGVFARTDSERGVWKAPAGVEAKLRGVQDLEYNLSDEENGVVNPLGINCVRSLAVYGRVIWGSRTLAGSDQEADDYKYIPVRRFALYLEESLFRGSKWVVFEPNDEPLWAQIRLNFGAFMHTLFRQGAFKGSSPKEAYYVKCDRETTTQDDINRGIVNIEVGFAPLKPAEFVIIKLAQITGQIET
jgi:phage tail sheath protein FI